MHIFIIGGSGRNGRLIVQAALAKGHTVTALVRNPDSQTSQPGITYIKGTPSSQTDVERALTTPQPPSAIMIALNARRTTENPFAPLAADSPPDLISASTKTLLAALANVALPRQPKLIINSSQGAGSSWGNMIFPVRILMHHSTMRVGIEDHNKVDALVRETGLKFVMPRPCMLAEGPAADVKVWPDNGKGAPLIPKITRESLAAWMVGAAERDEWDGKAPVITN